MQQIGTQAKKIIAKRSAELPAQTTAQPGKVTYSKSKLPDIALPRFTGNYTEWPSFLELFTSVVCGKPDLDQVEKFYYLKGCLRGEPAQIVASLPLIGSSLSAALEMLKQRYENKRRLVQAHLDQLVSLPMDQDHAKALSQLMSTAMETRHAVQNLIEPGKLGDCLLVHQVCRKMDHATKERWETTLGVTTEYPSFQEAMEFITSRIRTLEQLADDKARASASKTAQSKPAQTKAQQITTSRPAHAAVAARPAAQARPSAPRTTERPHLERPSPFECCDCCGGQHYIVACALFRSMTPKVRAQTIEDKRLCYNCLGRHSVRACKSAQKCKHCGEKHHTMIHEGEPKPAPVQAGSSRSASSSAQTTE
ncbi:uncharacterized protein LOC123989230 [Osmia bicornis bicornis]|uniref:uncharacterized protein LOC123989230 n=1 Tax=Osmia bicornis bicornis TaxID=1437191 RepID=UPI001EAEE827|nr:uncharacterized protein LOC123989230 [Osmia bicornis bicornis]